MRRVSSAAFTLHSANDPGLRFKLCSFSCWAPVPEAHPGNARSPPKLADHLDMVREVYDISPFQSARFGEQPTSRTSRLPLSRASADPSRTIRLKVFSPLLLRQKPLTGRNGRKRRSMMVQMVRELSPCALDVYARFAGSNGCFVPTPKRAEERCRGRCSGRAAYLSPTRTAITHHARGPTSCVPIGSRSPLCASMR